MSKCDALWNHVQKREEQTVAFSKVDKKEHSLCHERRDF